ncbi:SMP-30/Gluconolactonase/LRE-like region domain-containing protein [Caenorhabditis elegans]|uniref:SMP-30/Gluconolactonase/LRE-like region domain-containing protein n=1 Tax=Caenorhabditis elegans TaxID=6239 RepID=B1V898_CAEEL|nr:SMP-30/Gluconolactonase/LRE-like region domain-containing protein [Caenorhabditis elegans]CCD68581.1 SMP-30/Gluconolactonase/LRE-like region domain-containing protein [Caenorhabditis elegans]|eukprot:NP_001122440.1 PON (paraoxonase) and MEC-6 Like [Caenorhabditis elegans]
MLKIVLVVLLAFLVQYVFKTLLMFDINKRTYNHRPGPCRKVDGPVHGSEDIAIVEELNLAFITSGLVYLIEDPTQVTWKGQIFAYDLSKKTYKAESIPIVNLEDGDGFHPHGISHWIKKDGSVRLFVVVHSKQFRHSIAILDFDKTKWQLNHVKTVRDDKFVRPNDVVATGENSFLVSNDGGAQTIVGNAIEMFTGFFKGGLVYFDGMNSHYLLENTVANGIILSRDRKTLFVSHINQETIGVFAWDQKKITIKKISEIETLTGCDNFFIDNEDNLWSGCHPVLKDAVGHLGDATNPNLYSQSQVLRFKFSSDLKSTEMLEVFSDDGRFTAASAIAATFDNGKQLLIGTVFRDLTHCDIDVPLDF